MLVGKGRYKVGYNTENLKVLVSQSGLSQRQVAGATGIPHATLVQVLSGRIVPNVSLFLTLADGIKGDNRPENLSVMTRSEHAKLHWMIRKGVR